MYIIFGNVGYWQIPILKILKYFKLNVYYLYIEAKSDVARNEIAMKLKLNNIFPLPIEFEKKISPQASFSLCESDPNEIIYKKNIKLASDAILKKLVEDNLSIDEIVAEGYEVEDVKKISMLLSRSEYKRFQSAPGPKVTEKAFGRDRRYPLTSGFRNWN